MKTQKAFTLAEVLITLMILGVIAMIVVPGAIQKANDRADIVKIKKVYTTLDRAIKFLVLENGNDDLFSMEYSSPPNKYFYQRLKPYLRVAKDCGMALYWYGSSCEHFTNLQNYKNLNGTPINLSLVNADYIVLLQDGTLLIFRWSLWKTAPMTSYAEGNPPPYVGNIDVDINGFAGPNRLGYDYFRFLIGERGLIWPDPNLVYLGGHWVPPATTSHKDYCKLTGTNSAFSCAYWAIKHGNMDYKYRDVSSEW